MFLKESIRNRRSIRKYQLKEVPCELILEILEATSWAPSPHNCQPWRFIVIQDTKTKEELAEAMAEAWAVDLIRDGATVEKAMRMERVKRFANAPALILACLTMEGLRKFSDAERQNFERDLAVESLGATIENMLLVAHSIGLGACWFCSPAFCKQTVREKLKIPLDVEPSALIILGYPNEKPPTPAKKPLREVCYLDVWGRELS